MKKMSIEAAGDTAAYYDQVMGPLFFEPYAREVAERLDQVNVRIALEIAAGTGRVTRHIRERLPLSATLIASDINEDMLQEAKKKLSHLAIEWQHIDAQQLPFADNSIDLVVCCFGYMFVNDKPKAFAEACRVLRPGGQFICTTWDSLEQNAASFITRSIAKQYLQEPLPASYAVATSMHDEKMIARLMKEAGFAKYKVEKVKQSSVSPSAKEAAEGLVEGGIFYKEIKAKNPAWIAEIKRKVAKELGEKFGEAPMVAPISAVIAQAWK